MTKHEASVSEHEVTVNLMYPKQGEDKVTIALYHVRAADDLTVQYDFNRDGWVMTREVCKHTEEGGIESLGIWVEVGFVPSWTMEVGSDEVSPPSV